MGSDRGDVQRREAGGEARAQASRIPSRLTWAAVADFYMSRYSGWRLVDVARVPYETHQDLMEAARLNTVSPDDIDSGKPKKIASEAQLESILRGLK